MRKSITFCLLLVFAERTVLASTSFFSSTSKLEILLTTQGHLIKHILYFVKEYEELFSKQATNIFKKYLRRCKEEHKKALNNISYYLGNPINAYNLIKRLYIDLHYIEKITRTRGETSDAVIVSDDKIMLCMVRYSVFTEEKRIEYPEREDLEGAVEGILRVQTYYHLHTKDLAKGIIIGNFSQSKMKYLEKTTPLLPRDCFEIGRIALGLSQYKLAMEWLLEAIYKCNDDDDYHLNHHTLIDAIKVLLKTYLDMGQGDSEDFKTWKEKLKTFKEDKDKHTFDYKDLIPERQLIDKFYPEETAYAIREIDIREQVLCRGSEVLPSHEAQRLKCYYLRGPDPYLQIAPVKTEELYLDPDILLFYDVMSDREIRYIQNEIKSTLERAIIRENEISHDRISQTQWITDSDPVVARVSRRVSYITGLNVATAEALQVNNYGIGGFYTAHHDFKNDTTKPERMATVNFYMSDVEQGGATVFLELNLTVFPVKGAALYWMNLHPSGDPNYRTGHAACPVLRGTKWVSNKWLMNIGQELYRPCPLKYLEKYSETNNEFWKYN